MNVILMTRKLLDESSVLERANVDIRVTACSINQIVLTVHPQIIYFAHLASLWRHWECNGPSSLLNWSRRWNGIAGDDSCWSDDEELTMEGERKDLIRAFEHGDGIGDLLIGDVLNACCNLLDSKSDNDRWWSKLINFISRLTRMSRYLRSSKPQTETFRSTTTFGISAPCRAVCKLLPSLW